MNQYIKVSCSMYSVPPIVHMVQGDTGRVLICELADHTLASTDAASLICMRPDGSVYRYTGTISTTNNTVTVTMSAAGGALTQAGPVASQLIITSSNSRRVTSFKIDIIVEPVVGGEVTPDERTFFSALQSQLDTLVARMNQYERLPDGSTTGDAELADIRIGADGTSYTNAGTAVRTQISNLKSVLDTSLKPYTGSAPQDNLLSLPMNCLWLASGSTIKPLLTVDPTSIPYTKIENTTSYIVKKYTFGPANTYGIIELGTRSGSTHFVGLYSNAVPNTITWYDRSYSEFLDLQTKATYYLTNQEVSALNDLFDVPGGKYFTATGARLKQLISNAPTKLNNTSSYLVLTWSYGSSESPFLICEILRANGIEHYWGYTYNGSPDEFIWNDLTNGDTADIKKNSEFNRSILPEFSGDYFSWTFGRYLLATGELSSVNPAGVSGYIDVSPGTIIKVLTNLTGDTGAESYTYIGLYKNGAWVRRSQKLVYGDEYVIGDEADRIRFCYGVPSASGAGKLTDEKVRQYFRVAMLTKSKQGQSFIETSRPLYIAIGGSSIWGAIHHFTGTSITQTKYKIPIMIGNALGLETVNLGVGSTGSLARYNDNNNYMDMIYYHPELFANAALTTIFLGYGNDSTAGLPIGAYDDYYPYDEAGYHPSNGEAGETEMINKGATWFGCLNWMLKWLGEKYPKTQVILIFAGVSIPQGRTVSVIANSQSESVGHPKYKLSFTDPYADTTRGNGLINVGLKTLVKKLNIPLINIFEDGMPFSYYNATAKKADGTYAIFSTTGDASDPTTWTLNGHLNDDGYIMFSRFITGKVVSQFYRI